MCADWCGDGNAHVCALFLATRASDHTVCVSVLTVLIYAVY